MVDFAKIAEYEVNKFLADCRDEWVEQGFIEELHDEIYYIAYDSVIGAGGSKEEADKIAKNIS